ncbi:MAG TPA: hypothetical protein VED86_06005 [archaeon]|nr:hypothetical protein [archaeon]
MRKCAKCDTPLNDQAAYCHACGASQQTGEELSGRNQQFTLPKTIFYVLMVGLALMGLVIVGLAVRGPSVVIQTNYVTEMQFTTYTASFLTTSTETQAYTVSMASFTTLPAGPPLSWFNGQYCGYPFNPYTCNEGPPVTVRGYLTNDTTCVDLYVGAGQTYVVWNLPQTEPEGAYQVYGFVYPNWPQTQPFPPYPFQKTLCIGIPLWAVPPYIQID